MAGLKIVVAGCVAAQEGETLLRRVPELALVLGPHHANRCPHHARVLCLCASRHWPWHGRKSPLQAMICEPYTVWGALHVLASSGASHSCGG